MSSGWRWIVGTLLTATFLTWTAFAGIPALGQSEVSTQALPRVEYLGNLTLAPDHGRPGTVVTATGTGLPANAGMELVWTSVKGQWVVKGRHNEEFHGRRFEPVDRQLRRVTTDGGGRFQTTFVAPEDFGFNHDVLLMQEGVIRNQAGFGIDMQVSMSPTSGPPGTPIRVVARGIGWQNMENSWMLLYDNRFTGWISAVTTRGRADFRLPATGRPGKHIIQIVHGSFTFPYMNMQQSPRPDRPTFTFEFMVTDGAPIMPPTAPSQGLAGRLGTVPPGSGPGIWTDIASGPVGTPFRILGRGLPPGQTVEFTWSSTVGNRVSGDGWADSSDALSKAVVDDAGALSLRVKVPDDLGGPHAITARISSKTVAETAFILTPSAVALETSSGPAGTTIKVHLKGVGWTETANIYHVVYDNAYIGYACGFNTQGDVQIFLKATGEPGWHFIDLYPGIYKGKDVPGVQNFRIPQLSYAADHPGERLPAFRFAFLVTK